MSVFWKKIEFCKEKSVCKVIVFAAWSFGQSPGGFSGGKGPYFVAFSISRRFTAYNGIKKTMFMT